MSKKVITYKIPRMEHQKMGEREAFRQYLECKRLNRPFGYAFFFAPGTGKSATFINTVRRIMLHEGQFKRILILCPPVVIANWRDEILKFSNIEPRRIILLTGKGDHCVKKFEATAFDHMKRKRAAIYITNYEKLVMSSALFNLVRQWEPEVMALDESHRLKNPKARRTKVVDELANPSPQKNRQQPKRPAVFNLSGTPILNSLLDIFPQFLMMDGGDSFGDNFFAFRARYFRSVNLRVNSQRQFLKWVPLKTSGKKIKEIVDRKSMAVRLEDCLDLPPLIEKKISVPMGAEQKKHYEEMRKQLITYIDSKACVAQLAITKALRLMQIASGFIQLDNGEKVFFKENPKLVALRDILEDVTPGRKVIIWSVFHANYEMIRKVCEDLKVKWVEIHGEVSTSKKREAEKSFQNDEEVRVLIGHPGSGGIGINLTAGCYTVYFSSNFSKENRDQSSARDYRKGSERHASITHVDLMSEGTIEAEVLKKLDEKNEISLSILRNII